MKVPFEKIGPGQSARLVYQVIGQNGPVFNPERIRYLSPDQAPDFESGPLSLPSAFTSLSALNLAASVGNVVLSAAVLRQVQQLHAKVDRVLFSLDRVEGKVDRLVQQVQRIDARVSENNLRHALDHVLNRVVRDDEIDLRGLARIKNDLESFAEGVEDGFAPCDSYGLRLSSDVEDKLESIYKLLFGIRYFIYTKHNAAAGGDPFRTLSINLTEDYFFGKVDPMLAAAGRKALEKMWEGQEQLGQKVFDDFTFADEIKANEYHDWLGETVISPVAVALSSGDSGALSLALEWETDISDLDQAAEYYDHLRTHWLWQTSAGLLWRTYVEMLGLSDGYNETWGLGRDQFEKIEDSHLLISGSMDQDEIESIIHNR